MKIKNLFSAYFTLLFLALFFLFFSCSSKDQSDGGDSISQMEFKVDADLLGNAHRDSVLKVQFQPPLNWQKPGEAMKAKAAALADSLSPYSIRLKEVFFDSASNAMMLFSDLNQVEAQQYYQLLQNYQTVFNAGKKWDQVQLTSFRFNRLTADQVLLQNQQLVAFKLLFYKDLDTKFQIDYLVPRKVYPEKVRQIESSMGSIRRLKG